MSTQFLQNFISKDNSNPIQFIYKRQLTNTSALRLLIEGFYSKKDTTTFSALLFPPHRYTFYAGLALGYEKQYDLAPKWKLHAGVDIKYGVNFYKEYGYFNGNIPVERLYIEREYDTRSLHFMPFIGIRYHIHPKIYIVLESHLNLQHSEMNSFVVLSNDRYGRQGDGDGYIENNIINLNYSGVQLFFNF
jgi:hypothetical protein